jgi:crotonobetainyl-CoA:carnitine CoA-transferase CaiB-like acyl-CoA transferase
MAAPLDGLRVLDLSLGPVGGMATMVLADFGADVVKVEPHGGDPLRSLANSPLWLRGKRSVELDLRVPGQRQHALRLAGAVDVLVTTLTEEEALGFDLQYERLSAGNPSLVYCRISGFGPRGPYADYPGYEGLVAAKSGRMQAFAGLAGREGPSYAAVQIGMHACSQSALTGVLAALIDREASGQGQLVEASLLQAFMAYDLLGLVRTELSRRHPAAFADDPMLTAVRAPTLNYHPLPTADGRWLQMGNLLQHLFDNYLVAAGLSDVFADPRYENPSATWADADREAFRDRMLLHMKERTAAEWMETFVEHGGVAATEYRTTQEAMADPDLILNGHVVEQDHPRLGRVRQLGTLARLTETPGSPGFPSRTPGEDNAALGSLWVSPGRRAAAGAAQPRSQRGPLAGITILEFATIIAAPLGVSVLADLGARVIKVEPIGGDPYRQLGLFGIMASKTNVSKQSIGVDMKRPEGQAIIAALVRRADALVHNYRPGVPERLGIGYEQCRALRPGIVHVSMNGYGPLGPGANRPSTHPVPGAAVGGATLQAGGAHTWTDETVEGLRAIAWRLFRANEANPDPNTSVVVASATLLALLAQRRSGAGQQVFVDMLGANAYANADDFIQYEGKPARTSPDADLLGLCATYRLYPAKEGWVFLALLTGGQFQHFCDLAGVPELARDPRFTSDAGRREHDSELSETLSKVFSERPAGDWERLLAPRGIGCVRADGPVPGEFWLDDAHVRENGFVTEVAHARYGKHLRWGPMATLHGSPAVPGPGALGGDHTSAILREIGYSDTDVARLYSAGVVWSEELQPLGSESD